MKQGSVAILLVLLAFLFIVAVQLIHHFSYSPKALKCISSTPVVVQPKQEIEVVVVFGREFPASRVRQWHAIVAKNYVCCAGTVRRADEGLGEPLSYERFVEALQNGYSFPELKGEGVWSDGDKTILTHKPMSRIKKRNSSSVHQGQSGQITTGR